MDTRIVVIGGGVLGSSIAYHLAVAGERGVLLVERDEIGAATTSCAAGLLGQVRPTRVEVQLVQRTFASIRARPSSGACAPPPDRARTPRACRPERRKGGS
ncbi:MAG: FAD-binding oxidoreductase [Candidatus Rokubacteria bacterium]|nr:FAD-binding oxidoreductase [Candidatus Rokubacteria bacterium]